MRIPTPLFSFPVRAETDFGGPIYNATVHVYGGRHGLETTISGPDLATFPLAALRGITDGLNAALNYYRSDGPVASNPNISDLHRDAIESVYDFADNILAGAYITADGTTGGYYPGF